jgi:hypothetical protein
MTDWSRARDGILGGELGQVNSATGRREKRAGLRFNRGIRLSRSRTPECGKTSLESIAGSKDNRGLSVFAPRSAARFDPSQLHRPSIVPSAENQRRAPGRQTASLICFRQRHKELLVTSPHDVRGHRVHLEIGIRTPFPLTSQAPAVNL